MPSGFGEEQQKPLTGYPVGDLPVGQGGTAAAKLKVGPGGRVLIPAGLREQLGVVEGDALMATFENGELRLMSLAESVRRAQALVKAKVGGRRSLVDELLEERRQEVEKERLEDERARERRRGRG